LQLEVTAVPTEPQPGGSPGLVVKGGDLFSEGCEFESQHRILDVNFCIEIVLLFAKTKNKLKRGPL